MTQPTPSDRPSTRRPSRRSSRRSGRRLATGALAIGAFAMLAAACGDDGGTGENGTVTIYSGRAERLIQPILDDFADETDIAVEVKYGGSADLALLLEEEAASGNVQADVFLSQSPGSIGFLDDNDRLAELPASTLDLVPDTVRDAEGRWVGFSGRQRVLVYNAELVDPAELPASVFDMTAPEWSGRVGVAPSNGSFQDFVTAMRVTEGDDVTMQWLEDLAANNPVTYSNNSAIVAAVGRGEVDTGLVNHYYNYRAIDENPDVPSRNHLFAPGDPGSLLIVTGAGMLEGTDDPDLATALIDFLLSPAGQEYFADETFEYPLATGTEPSGDVPPIEFGDVSNFDYGRLGGGLEQTRQMIADAGLQG